MTMPPTWYDRRERMHTRPEFGRCHRSEVAGPYGSRHGNRRIYGREHPLLHTLPCGRVRGDTRR